MRCPYCGSEDTQVKDSRPAEDNTSIRRRRICPDCGGRFTTFERVQLRDLTVVKKSGRKVPFDREKLARSVYTALRKRSVDPERIERMISGIVRQLESLGDVEVTSDQIGELWLSVQEESLGPAIRISEGYENWWTYIPHFIHSPFYVYAYAFGDCLVNSLYAVYQNAEPGFQQKYFELLKAGGTKHHSELLAPFGLDATDPSFWSKGLSMIEGLIDELEALDET